MMIMCLGITNFLFYFFVFCRHFSIVYRNLVGPILSCLCHKTFHRVYAINVPLCKCHGTLLCVCVYIPNAPSCKCHEHSIHIYLNGSIPYQHFDHKLLLQRLFLNQDLLSNHYIMRLFFFKICLLFYLGYITE